MKYLKQFMVILVFSFLGEALHFFLPLPVPASIYGLITFFICLCAKLITPSEVKETSSFLIEIMPFLFIPSAVGLMKIWKVLAPVWLPFVAITVIATFAVIIVSGKFVQFAERFSKSEVQAN